MPSAHQYDLSLIISDDNSTLFSGGYRTWESPVGRVELTFQVFYAHWNGQYANWVQFVSVPFHLVALRCVAFRSVPFRSIQFSSVQICSVQSSPVQSSPVSLQSSPVQSSPVQSSPVQSSPVQSSPVQSSPVQSSPVQSSESPVQSSPIESVLVFAEKTSPSADWYPSRASSVRLWTDTRRNRTKTTNFKRTSECRGAGELGGGGETRGRCWFSRYPWDLPQAVGDNGFWFAGRAI